MAIEKYPLPSKVIIPTVMHIGSPAKVIVKNGDKVTKGQIVAEASGFVSSPAFSSISGVVSSIGMFPHASGKSVAAVEITADGKNGEFRFEPIKNYKEQPAAVLTKRISDCGIVGMGGAGFPAHVKLSPPPDKKIDTLIINAAECEPYLTTDHRSMLEMSDKLLWGIKILRRILGAKYIFIAIEKNKQDAIDLLRDKIDENKKFDAIKIIPLETKYPQGGEKQLVFAVTGREIPSGKLTMDAGCVVQNVASTVAAYDAIIEGIPLTERVLTVTGSAVKKPGNYLAPIGTNVREILEYCQTDFSRVKKVIMGGPMMGVSLANIDVPIMKQTSGILVLEETTPADGENNCINCGNCVWKCPIRLVPSLLAKYSEKNMFDEAKERNIMDCMECGCCSYICPAKINILHKIRFAKNSIVRMQTDKS
jgi:electron transport complex protein RnfC